MAPAGTTDLYSIVYVSQATRALSEADLEMLLADARYYNEAVGVTGFLAYERHDVRGATGTFVQCIEGGQDIIVSLFAERIEPASQHTNIQIKRQGEIQERSFPEWSMAFERTAEGALEGFSDLINKLGPPPRRGT